MYLKKAKICAESLLLGESVLETAEVPRLHTERIVEKGGQENIKHDIRPHNAEVAPALAPKDINAA